MNKLNFIQVLRHLGGYSKKQSALEEANDYDDYLKSTPPIDGYSTGIDWAEDSGKSEKEKLLDISSMEFLRQT